MSVSTFQFERSPVRVLQHLPAFKAASRFQRVSDALHFFHPQHPGHRNLAFVWRQRQHQQQVSWRHEKRQLDRSERHRRAASVRLQQRPRLDHDRHLRRVQADQRAAEGLPPLRLDQESTLLYIGLVRSSIYYNMGVFRLWKILIALGYGA